MTSRPRLVVSRTLLPAIERRIAQSFVTDEGEPGADLVARAVAHRADGLLVCITDTLSADVIERLPNSVRVIATYSVGFNHIDVEAARQRGIVVTYTPDAVTDATADCALLLLLGACRMAHGFQLQMWNGEWKMGPAAQLADLLDRLAADGAR